MLKGIGTLNIKVLLLDIGFYALKAVNSYLAWDRRTRVTLMAENDERMWDHIHHTPEAELPDVAVLDVVHLSPKALRQTISDLQAAVPGLIVICLLQQVDLPKAEAAAEAGARGILLKDEVRLQIAGAIIYTMDHDFVVSRGIARAVSDSRLANTRLFRATRLPERRHYPELTDRLRQAIELCVVEGMPAHLAADEMGISLHTIRGYVKDGYRILEAHDDTEYPVEMTPQERAFMRFTALEDDV
ncbi:response regulator transcription factor [bacterium]|nr:response regulator transcription factor [bacterium]